MSAILILGMEMPKHCIDCPCMVDKYGGDNCCLQSEEANEKITSWDDMKAGCPLHELPEHGDLHAKVPKQGEWLPHQNAQFNEVDVCSVCGIGTRKMYHCTDGIQTWDEKPFFRYCPWCGAKLSEPSKGVK